MKRHIRCYCGEPIEVGTIHLNCPGPAPKWICKYCDGVGRHKVGCRCKAKPHLRLHYLTDCWQITGTTPGGHAFTTYRTRTAKGAVYLASREW